MDLRHLQGQTGTEPKPVRDQRTILVLSGTCRVRVLAQASGHQGFEVDAFVADMAITHAIPPIDVGVQRIDAGWIDCHLPVVIKNKP